MRVSNLDTVRNHPAIIAEALEGLGVDHAGALAVRQATGTMCHG